MESTLFEFDYNKELKPLDMVIDWVQVTFQELSINNVLRIFFGVTPGQCTKTDSGLYGYNCTFTISSKIHVMVNNKRPDMGVHIQMSGSACREYEMCFTWDYFFKQARLLNGHFTRLDIAIDCYKKYFTVNMLKNKIKNGCLVSKFKKTSYHTQYMIKDGTQHSATLHFGSMKSDIYIVVYDKLAERYDAGYSVADNINFWTRVEIRFKKDNADSMIDNYINDPFSFSSVVMKVLYNYLDFKEEGSSSQKTRWKTCKFWLDFLNESEKLSISNKAVQSSIQQKIDYMENYMSKIFAMCMVCDNSFTRNLAKQGLKKINDYDLSVINSFLMSNNMRIITRKDLDDFHEHEEQIQLFKPVG